MKATGNQIKAYEGDVNYLLQSCIRLKETQYVNDAQSSNLIETREIYWYYRNDQAI